MAHTAPQFHSDLGGLVRPGRRRPDAVVAAAAVPMGAEEVTEQAASQPRSIHRLRSASLNGRPRRRLLEDSPHMAAGNSDPAIPAFFGSQTHPSSRDCTDYRDHLVTRPEYVPPDALPSDLAGPLQPMAPTAPADYFSFHRPAVSQGSEERTSEQRRKSAAYSTVSDGASTSSPNNFAASSTTVYNRNATGEPLNTINDKPTGADESGETSPPSSSSANSEARKAFKVLVAGSSKANAEFHKILPSISVDEQLVDDFAEVAQLDGA
ncbi:hypothetical protein HK405_006682 [Cladochytrium tenue]|nr:hypothetical protein HK405_006682 [Cladochytrium tenue]